ncbi:class I SAM-dependent methyltransferase [Chryseolinea sp. H1M3-3]|uniref:O-methyltransferase n=1 Tax=Chryseolinea sp. H1M3-3 TaxID=3034144 RepID=UPI0023EAC750|nr:class I SAM-dependent methyltransferase [Chryseolinea sp. H1M3-3]
MSVNLFQLKSYFNYWLDAVDEHSLHSPFLFDFYTNLLKKKRSNPTLVSIEIYRKSLEQDHRTIHVTDLGAGSVKLKTSKRKVSDIARVSTTPKKFSSLYSRIIGHYQCRHIIELGTSLGVNTLYLANAHKNTQVVTFEGSSAIASIANKGFQEDNGRHIRMIEGNIDKTLPSYLTASPPIDFAYIDANHRLEPTLRYFEGLVTKMHSKSILVMDDIHYSKEMEVAWQTVQRNKAVTITIDLYRCGLVFFDTSLTKQNVVLQF